MLLNDPNEETPTSSSMSFFGLDSQSENLEEELEDLKCISQIVDENIFSTATNTLINSITKISNSEEMNQEIQKQKVYLNEIESYICEKLYPKRCNKKEEGIFIQNLYDKAFIKNAKIKTEKLNTLRRELSNLREKLKILEKNKKSYSKRV